MTAIYDITREQIFKKTTRRSVIPYDPTYQAARDNMEMQLGSYWTHNKVDFTEDKKNFDKMPLDIQQATLKVLGYFANSDEIVEEIISKSCLSRITVPEIKEMYIFEAMMEKTHSKVYNLNIQAVVHDEAEQHKLFNAITTMPTVRLKAEYAQQWISDKRSPAYTLVGKAATEGINFSSSFAWIDWLKSQNYKLEGTFEANGEISRDEARHVDTSFIVYKYLEDKLPAEVVQKMLDESEAVELQFVQDMMPRRILPGMSYDDMKQHVRHSKALVAAGLGYPDLYVGTSCPFSFMKNRSLATKTNFFEKRTDEYTRFSSGDVDMAFSDNAGF